MKSIILEEEKEGGGEETGGGGREGRKTAFRKATWLQICKSLGFKGQSNETGPLLLPFLSN